MLSILLGMVLFLGLIVPLVILHEYGHFLVARRNKIEVEEFGVGFPPRLGGKTLGKGIWKGFYTINLLPLGGFVRLRGESDADKRKGSFGGASFKTKAKILLAGVGINYVIALILFSVVAAIRLPVIVPDQFTVAGDTTQVRSEVIASFVVDGSAANQAGLRPGDIVKSVDRHLIKSADELLRVTSSQAGNPVEVVYIRDGIEKSETVTLAKNPVEGRGYLGVRPRERIERRSTWTAPFVGIVVTHQLAWESLKAFGAGLISIVKGDSEGVAAAGVAGPVGIASILSGGIDSPVQFLLILASLSLSLALLNALPIPALDGGRLALIAAFRLLRRPLTSRVEEVTHGLGFAALMLLVVVVSIFDVINFF